MKNSITQGNFINKHRLKANENEELPKFLFMAVVMLWRRLPAAAVDSPALHILNSGTSRGKQTLLDSTG